MNMPKKLMFFLLIAILFSGISAFFVIRFTQNDSEKKIADYPPLIMYNDLLYIHTIDKSANNITLENVGKIKSYVDYGLPTENYQANDDFVGCDIYVANTLPDYIFVLYNGDYLPYKFFEK